MEVSISSEILKDAILKLTTVVDRKSSRPILTNCLVTLTSKNIILEATDTEVSVKIILNSKNKDTGSFCINIKNFSDILRELPNDELTLKIDNTKNNLKLECGAIDYSLVICSAEEFPNLVFEHSGSEFFLKSNDINKMISKISHAISTDETRLYLNGIYLQHQDSILKAVAIDGHRLALLDVPEFLSKSQFLNSGIIIPRKGVNELKKLAESYPNETIKFSVDESFLFANYSEKYFISVRLISRDYPKYQAVVPSKTQFNFNINKESLFNAVKRIKILANEKNNGIKFSITKGKLIVSTNHPAMGEAKEELITNYDGKDFNIGFNAKYLIDTLSVLDEGDITLEFNNELSPVVLKSPTMKEFLGIIMPLKI